MVRGRARGGKGSMCPHPPKTTNRPTWPPPYHLELPHLDPPPQPTLPEPPPPPSPSTTCALLVPSNYFPMGTCRIVFQSHGGIAVTQVAVPKRGSPSPQHPNSRGHTEPWESITPTREAKPNCGSPSPQLERHTDTWESLTPTRRAQ